MLKVAKLALIGVALAFGTAAPTAAQSYDPFTQCLIDYCAGHYVGDPVGYRRCWEWCAAQTGGPYIHAGPANLVAKLD